MGTKWKKKNCLARACKNIITRSSGAPQITFSTWVLNRWPKTEESRGVLDHTGSQAVLLHCTPSALWLQLLWPISYVCACVCSCTYTHIPVHRGLSGRSCPYLYAGLRGEADPSVSWSHFKEPTVGLWMYWAVPGWPAHGCCFPGLWELGSWEFR